MTMKKKSKYFYSGPVKLFQNTISSHWEGVTWAVSEAKALCNLSYQYKIEHHMLADTNISLNRDYICELSTIDDDGYIYYDFDMRRMINEATT